MEGNTLEATVSPHNALAMGFDNERDYITYLLESAAEKNGLNEKRFKQLCFCESTLHHYNDDGTLNCGDNGVSCGLFQFQQPTWDRYCEGNREVMEDQVKCAAEMIKAGYKYHWSCKY